jgi:SHS2 domain-containing protein
MLKPQDEDYAYKERPHTGEWSIEISGEDLLSLMQGASEAMYELSGAKFDTRDKRRLEFDIHADDKVDLIVDFLSELLGIWTTQKLGLIELDIKTKNNESWHCLGTFVPIIKQQKTIKAITYHGLDMESPDESLKTTVTFDM